MQRSMYSTAQHSTYVYLRYMQDGAVPLQLPAFMCSQEGESGREKMQADERTIHQGRRSGLIRLYYTCTCCNSLECRKDGLFR